MLQKEKTSIKSRRVKTFEPNKDAYSFLGLPKYNIFFFISFSTALQKLQKIVTCFPEDTLSEIYSSNLKFDLQILKVFTPRLLMHVFFFILEHQ